MRGAAENGVEKKQRGWTETEGRGICMARRNLIHQSGEETLWTFSNLKYSVPRPDREGRSEMNLKIR